MESYKRNMFEFKKSKASLICLLIGMALLVLGFVSGSESAMECFIVFGVIVLIVALSLEMVNSSNKKKHKILMEALEKDPNASAITNYRTTGQALEFPKVFLIVTPEAVLSVSKNVNIYLFKDIDRLYRCNMFNGQYSLTQQGISLDLKSGKREFVAVSMRNNKAMAKKFDEALSACQKAFGDFKLLEETPAEGGNE